MFCTCMSPMKNEREKKRIVTVYAVCCPKPFHIVCRRGHDFYRYYTLIVFDLRLSADNTLYYRHYVKIFTNIGFENVDTHIRKLYLK